MENLLSIPNNILFGSLRPWSKLNQEEEKFQYLLNLNLRSNKQNPSEFFKCAISAFKQLNISTEQENIKEFELLSKIKSDKDLIENFLIIKLPVFFNKQTEFYSILLRNELIGILEITFEQLKNADEIEIKYNLYHLFEKLKELLSRISELTFDNKITLFVIDTLKLCLLNIHFELVRHYSEFLDFEILSESEILFFVSPDFEQTKAVKTNISFLIEQFLSESQSKLITEESIISVKLEQEETIILPEPIFIPRQSDFRGSGKSPVSYADIRNVVAFSKFEQELFESKIINSDYEFLVKRGNKEMIAALYKILIQKNYFRKTNIKTGRNFDPSHYRQYFDHRYNVDTSQQFRKCTSEDIQAFKQKHCWIDNIEYCR
jgi:hypothetical protein